MSQRYPLPDIANLPEDLRTKILEVQEKAGFVPNVFLALARRPAVWRAFFALSNRMASVTGMMPNPEFYLMGRAPKAKN
jgi:alkylhydroperoxidase family enzyme